MPVTFWTCAVDHSWGLIPYSIYGHEFLLGIKRTPPAHFVWYLWSASSKFPTCLSDWNLKVCELQRVIQTSQDTNTLHLQQGSLDVCELYVVVGTLANGSEAVVKGSSLESFVSVGVSSNESPSHNRNPHSWDGTGSAWKSYNSVATATFDWNGKTQPTAECHVLQLKHLGLLPRLFYNTALKQHRALELPKLLREKVNSTKTQVLQSSNGAITWIIRFATSNLLVGVRNWKSYNSVATAHFDRRNGKTQPTAECHVLQQKHSGAQKVLLYLCFLICDTALKQQRSLELPNCFSETSTALKPGYYSGSQPLRLKLHLVQLDLQGME